MALTGTGNFLCSTNSVDRLSDRLRVADLSRCMRSAADRTPTRALTHPTYLIGMRPACPRDATALRDQTQHPKSFTAETRESFPVDSCTRRVRGKARAPSPGHSSNSTRRTLGATPCACAAPRARRLALAAAQGGVGANVGAQVLVYRVRARSARARLSGDADATHGSRVYAVGSECVEERLRSGRTLLWRPREICRRAEEWRGASSRAWGVVRD